MRILGGKGDTVSLNVQGLLYGGYLFQRGTGCSVLPMLEGRDGVPHPFPLNMLRSGEGLQLASRRRHFGCRRKILHLSCDSSTQPGPNPGLSASIRFICKSQLEPAQGKHSRCTCDLSNWRILCEGCSKSKAALAVGRLCWTEDPAPEISC